MILDPLLFYQKDGCRHFLKGVKNQLVCIIALAVRYRAIPFLMGTIAAFAFLNLATVIVVAAVPDLLSQYASKNYAL